MVLAKLIEREAGTFLVSVPALQGRGLFLRREGCEAVKADLSFSSYLARGWPVFLASCGLMHPLDSCYSQPLTRLTNETV